MKQVSTNSTFAGYDETRPPSAEVWARREGTLRVSDRVRRSVVFIGVVCNGRFTPLGTGFVVASEHGGMMFQNIVTARHVIETIAGDKVMVRANKKTGGAEVWESDKDQWLFHPDAKQSDRIDVAVLPSSMPPDYFDIAHVHLGIEPLTDEVIQQQSIGPGDEVFVTGLFTSHAGEERNIPVVRCGTIAAMPEERIWTTRGYCDAYLIEVHSIAGLSGSPVFLQVAPFRVIEGNVQTAKGYTHYLMGVVQGHFVVQNPSDVVSDTDAPGGIERTNTGIGVVVPVSKILETIHQPALELQRISAAVNAKKKAPFVEDAFKRPVIQGHDANNPTHKEDFTSLLNAAARKKPQGD